MNQQSRLILPDSIQNVVRRVAKRVRLYGIFLMAVLGIALIGAMSRQAGIAVCALVEARLAAVQGPISRELVLEESQTVAAIMKSINSDLGKAGILGFLRLDRHDSGVPLVSGAHCSAGLLTVKVSYPIRFGGNVLAMMSGTLGFLPRAAIWGFLVLMLLGVALFFRILILSVVREIDTQLITPIRTLSEDGMLAPSATFPREVLEIQRNLSQMKDRISEQERKAGETRQAQQLAEVAAQVAHDIRSPLAALAVLERDLGGLDDEQRILLRSAVNRIKDIANDLLERNRAGGLSSAQGRAFQSPKQEVASVQLLSSLLKPVISEKCLQFRSRSGLVIDCSLESFSCGLFAKVQPIEFRRVISNLVNNAVEAIESDGRVSIELRAQGDHVQILISDNGRGIPEEIVKRLGRLGETYGKQGGSGLGLYHARMSVDSWGGGIEIDSRIGRGTTVLIALPIVKTPDWFVPRLEIAEGQTLPVLDDDPSSPRC